MRIWMTAVLAGTVMLVPAPTLGGQKFEPRLRETSADETPHYVFRFREMLVDASYSGELKWDDNTTQTTDDQEVGLEWVNALGLRWYWPLTPDHSLDAQITVGYPITLHGETEGGLTLATTADETFAADFKLGQNSMLSILDILSLNVESVEVPLQQKPGAVEILQNDLAIQYQVDLSPSYSLGMRVGCELLRTQGNSDFENLDRDTDYATARIGWDVNQHLNAWPYVSWSRNEHAEEINNDSTEFEIGLGCSWAVSDVTTMQMSVGHQDQQYDNTNDPAVVGDGSGLTMALTLSSALTDAVSHGLGLEYTRHLGTTPGVNYNRDATVSYTVGFLVSEYTYTKLDTTWMRSAEAGDTGSASDTRMVGVEVGHYFTEQLTGSVAWRWTERDSRDTGAGEYSRNQISVKIAYKF